MSSFSEKLVDFDIMVESEPRPVAPAKPLALTEQTSSLEESIYKLSGSLSSIQRTQKYFRTRENRNVRPHSLLTSSHLRDVHTSSLSSPQNTLQLTIDVSGQYRAKHAVENLHVQSQRECSDVRYECISSMGYAMHFFPPSSDSYLPRPQSFRDSSVGRAVVGRYDAGTEWLCSKKSFVCNSFNSSLRHRLSTRERVIVHSRVISQALDAHLAVLLDVRMKGGLQSNKLNTSVLVPYSMLDRAPTLLQLLLTSDRRLLRVDLLLSLVEEGDLLRRRLQLSTGGESLRLHERCEVR